MQALRAIRNLDSAYIEDFERIKSQAMKCGRIKLLKSLSFISTFKKEETARTTRRLA